MFCYGPSEFLTGVQGGFRNFCAKSYEQGVKEGGQFPVGRLAFMEACQEGVRLAG